MLEGEIAHRFFAEVLSQTERADLLSKEHFSVDGTMIETLPSLKSYRPKDEDEPPAQGRGRNPSVDFRGERRCRDNHDSKTDPEVLLFKKSRGTAAKLSYMGHLLMENRNGLVVRTKVTQATGKAEREPAVEPADALGGSRRLTLGADKNDHTQGFVEAMRARNVTPHVARHVARNDTKRSSAIEERTTCHEG